MEECIYLTVKLVCATFVLFKLWGWLFRGGGGRFWKLLFPLRQPNAKSDTATTVSHDDRTSVVGRTNRVLLTDPKAEPPSVVEATDLEPTGYIGQEEELTDEDIESSYEPSEPLPPDDELYDDSSSYPTDDELSSGVSFEEIGNAVDVLKASAGSDKRTKTRVAQTLYNIQNTDILDFITREVCAADIIDNLLSDCLDGNGFPKTGKVDSIKDFDIQKYV